MTQPNNDRKKKFCAELTFACIEISAKASVVMLNFLYGQGKIKDVWFLVSIVFIQATSSALFIKSAIYDRSKISDNWNKICSQVTQDRDALKQIHCLLTQEGQDDKDVVGQIRSVTTQQGKNEQNESSGSDQCCCDNMKCILIGMSLLQVFYIVGTSVAPLLYKHGKLDLMLYMCISTISFIIGVIPPVIIRRYQTFNDKCNITDTLGLSQVEPLTRT